MFNRNMLLVSAALLSIGFGSRAYSDVKLPAIISDNMVLQKSAKVPLWGWADAGETVAVKLNGQTATVTTGQSGKWMTTLDLAKSEKGPFELTVTGHNTLTVKNVLVGEVWLASGQSNMEFTVDRGDNAKAEIAAADFPEIRQFRAAHINSAKPLDDNPGDPAGWVVCSPKTAANFTAVGYFFAREIHQKIHTPVGLIHTSWGGTIAEAWTSQETLTQFPEFKDRLDLLKIYQQGDPPKSKEALTQAMAHWQQTSWPKDPENTGVNKGWAKLDYDDTTWKTIHVPGEMEKHGLPDFDGSIWFRKEFTLTEAQTQKDLSVFLGNVDDYDVTYLNGEKVGETHDDLRDSVVPPRRYTLPAKLLKTGKNVLAVRVFDKGGNGGIGTTNRAKELQISLDNQPLIPLAGDWKYQIETQLPPTDIEQILASRPETIGGDQNFPTQLYNGMLKPFIPYGLAGVIWYQGESNSYRAYRYRTLFPAMITDWRTRWQQAGGQTNLPFLFVQIANYENKDREPTDNIWAELREAQQMTLSLPHTGMAVAIDIGGFDIHPTNKQDVGHRLALNALAKVYGETVEFSGPLYQASQIEPGKIRLTFTHAQGLHAGRLPTTTPPTITGFAICGADRKFVWAKATLEGESVIVSSPQITDPVAVRYGWGFNPDVNLYNAAGLPMAPFRTDDFPGITKPRN